MIALGSDGLGKTVSMLFGVPEKHHKVTKTFGAFTCTLYTMDSMDHIDKPATWHFQSCNFPGSSTGAHPLHLVWPPPWCLREALQRDDPQTAANLQGSLGP